jgi:hypothetical protein
MAVSMPISPPPVNEWKPGWLPAYLANGVMGLRVPAVPTLGGIAILNGFTGVDADSGAESFARTPYPLATELEIDRIALHEAPERARLRAQTYDFVTGELTTQYEFDLGHVRAEVEVLTFCSRTMPMLVLQEVRVRVDRACDLAVSGGIDHRGVPGKLVSRDTRTRGSEQRAVGGSMLWRSHGDLATCGAAYVTGFSDESAEAEIEHDELEPLMTRYALRARSGRTYRLEQIGALVCETMHHQPDLQAVRLAYAGRLRGFETLRKDNRDAWAEIWRGRVQLVDAPSRWQAMADAAFFYLHTSVHSSSPTSTYIFGLAYWPNYHYYRGHAMWDVEAFVVPPLLLTNPDAARTLLEYRAERLQAARLNAQMWGFRGAQFPWESSVRHGEEASPGEGAASAHEHHVSLDVANAFSQFLHATHDWEWGRERAWHVLNDVAEWAESRGVRTDRGFEIHGVNGVAERKETVDNNAFVNMAASVVFREVADLARSLGHDHQRKWSELARSVYLPIDRNKVIRNHDGYRADEEKGETPEALAGLFPLTYECPADVERASLEFYLGLADKYVGAPMLSALLGVYAARLGDRERALELFERGYADFVIEPFSITAEYDPKVFPDQEVAGPFTANIGGFLTSCLYGLTGLRLGGDEPQSWCSRPVTMPSGWSGVYVDRIYARGVPASLTATHGDQHAAITFEA